MVCMRFEWKEAGFRIDKSDTTLYALALFLWQPQFKQQQQSDNLLTLKYILPSLVFFGGKQKGHSAQVGGEVQAGESLFK